MKKIALITDSLAMLASPAFAQEAKTVGGAKAQTPSARSRWPDTTAE